MSSQQRMPTIRIHSLDERELVFTLENTDTSMANAMRRVMISETPTMAIDIVEIQANSSPLHDEFLAHRLGLIPLVSKISLAEFAYTRECDCESGCPKCTVEFTLDKTCEGNEPMTVTSNDLQSDNPSVEPLQDPSLPNGIVITQLGKRQSLKLKAWAKKGVGKEHAKWSPVSTAVYQFEPSIQISHKRLEELRPEELQKFVESCPASVFQIGPGGRIVIPDLYRCMYCEECLRWAEVANKPDLLTVSQREPPVFRFKVETTGALEPKEIVRSSLVELEQKLMFVQQMLTALPLDDEQPGGAVLS